MTDLYLLEGIRDKYVYSLFNSFYEILKIAKENPEFNDSEIIEKIADKFARGKAYAILRDAKIMRLVNQDSELTELGNQWYETCQQNEGNPSTEILKRSCLNVPFFRQVYEQFKDVTNIETLYGEFHSLLNKEEPKKIGSCLRRYLEGFYGIKIRKKVKFLRIKNKLLEKERKRITGKPLDSFTQKIIENEPKDGFSEYILLQKKLKEMSQEFGKDRIKEMLDLI